MKRPDMWIMKDHPNQPERTEEIFDCLFCRDNSRNVIGWSKEDEGEFQRFMNYWESFKIGDIVVIMKGTRKTVGCVIIVSKPYEEEGIDDCEWFNFKRRAKLLKKFDPPIEHKTGTNRDTIIQYSGEGAKSIMDEVWEMVADEYSKKIENIRHDRLKKEIERFRLILGLSSELSALTRGLSTFCTFHCFSIAPGTTEKGHKALYISSFKFSFRNFDIYNRFIYLHFIPAVGTTVVVFFRRRAKREV
jgi:hypothetical protein